MTIAGINTLNSTILKYPPSPIDKGRGLD